LAGDSGERFGGLAGDLTRNAIFKECKEKKNYFVFIPG
jgi:hypothetical protein